MVSDSISFAYFKPLQLLLAIVSLSKWIITHVSVFDCFSTESEQTGLLRFLLNFKPTLYSHLREFRWSIKPMITKLSVQMLAMFLSTISLDLLKWLKKNMEIRLASLSILLTYVWRSNTLILCNEFHCSYENRSIRTINLIQKLAEYDHTNWILVYERWMHKYRITYLLYKVCRYGKDRLWIEKEEEEEEENSKNTLIIYSSSVGFRLIIEFLLSRLVPTYIYIYYTYRMMVHT